MDISLKHENYKLIKEDKSNSFEECIEAEISLPEYMPEILRIIKATATPKIYSCNASENRITVDGVCDLRLIYTSEDNCIYTFCVTKPFTKYFENEEFTQTVDIEPELSVSYVNFRATGTRKSEIKTGILIKLHTYSEKLQDIIALEDNSIVEEKCVPLNVYSAGCKKTKPFSLSDTLSVNVPSAFLVDYSACAVLTDARKINNKVMIKGEAIVNICYVNYNDKSSTEAISHILPINQILEFPGMEEVFDGNVNLNITSVEVVPKGESGGACSSFDISIGVNASVNMWEQKEILLITDAYSTQCSVDLKKEEYIFYKDLYQVNETFVYDGSFSVPGEGVSCILEKNGYISDIGVKSCEGCITVSGCLQASFIIKDNSGAPSCVNKSFDFSFNISKDVFNSGSVFLPQIKLISVNCTVKGENSIDVKAEINISGCSFGRVTLNAVTNIEKSDRPFIKNRNAITVYFPENKNESLWSIAGRYNTTVKAIAEENNLEGDTTENKNIIFIPYT